MYALARDLDDAQQEQPPSSAPGMEPMPPNTAAVNALMPGMEPVVGMSDVLNEQSSTPAMAASAEPMAKVAEMVALTLMPMSCAAALSSEQARMALPILLLLTNSGQREHDDDADRDGQKRNVGDGEPSVEEARRPRDHGRCRTVRLPSR